MKWIPQDVEMYLKAKEYVDTAVIPLIPLSFGRDMKEKAAMSEFITLTADLLEKQFAGRVMLLPPFTYLTTDIHEKRLQELNLWTTILNNHFNHIFFLTSDSDWKLVEERLNETLIWVPACPLGDFEAEQKRTIIDSQVNQIMHLFTNKWHNNGLL